MSKQEKWRIRKYVQRHFPTKGKRCVICGSTENLHRHHIDENIRNNKPGNITILCKNCHQAVHSHAAEFNLKSSKIDW